VVKKGGGKGGQPASRFYAILGVIAVAGLAVIAFVATRSSANVTTVDTTLGPAVAEGYLYGSPNAPVQIIEFADFECPACAQFAAVTEPDVRKRLIDQGTVALRFYDFPLQQHPNSLPASLAAACAADQGKFWEMHDALFNAQDSWNGVATSRPKGVFEGFVRQLGLDAAKWEECYDSQRHRARILANQKEGERRRVGQTPTFIIGDKLLPGAISYDRLKAYVDTALAAVQAAAAAKGDTVAKSAAGSDTAGKTNR
jgi:protein-disulfide isomerase